MRRRLASGSLGFEAGSVASGLAGAHMLLTGEMNVEVAGLQIRAAQPETAFLIYPQVLEWERGIPREALAWFCEAGVLDATPETLDAAFFRAEEVVRIDRDLCRAAARSLVEEAGRNARYVPEGRFILELPHELPLRFWNVDSLRLWVEPWGMWVGVCTPEGKVPLSFRWQPGEPLSSFVVDPLLAPLVEAVLAAVWHDMRVGGEEVVRPRGKPPAPRSEPARVPAPEAAVGRAARPRVKTLPAPIRIRLEGRRE